MIIYYNMQGHRFAMLDWLSVDWNKSELNNFILINDSPPALSIMYNNAYTTCRLVAGMRFNILSISG